MTAQLLIDSKCTLGEGATWDARRGRFYWVDIEGAKLWRYDPRDQSSHVFDMPERLANFAFCADADTFLLGLVSRLAFFSLSTGEITTITEVEPDLPTRLNDGRCDREGRFVFGTLHEAEEQKPVGGFYRLNTDLTLERLPLGNCAQFQTASASVRTARACITATRPRARFVSAITRRLKTTACLSN